jgi:hypothetical protein
MCRRKLWGLTAGQDHVILITGFVTRLTRRVSLVEHELPTVPEQYPRIRRVFLKIPKGIRIRISKKNRQHNGQKKQYKRINNYLQIIHIKLKIQ